MRIPYLLLLLVFCSGCSIFFGSKDAPKSAKNSHYIIEFKSPGWIMKKEEISDYVFENVKDGRILLSNSFCEEFQEEPLKQLAMKTFKTVQNFKVNASKYTTFRNREAYQLEGAGKVDGVRVGLKILNTRRDNCYFDFVAITPEMAGPAPSAFDSFLEAVTFK